MGDGVREVSTAWRSLRRAPGFAAVAILTLGIGIGANALVFGLVDGVLLEPLPYPDSDRIVRVWNGATVPAAEYDYFSRNATSVVDVGGYSTGVSVNLVGDSEPIRVIGSRVTRSFLDILGAPLAMGGGFSAGADEVGGPDEVILSNGLWTTRYGADPGILGRTLNLDGTTHTIVGVLPAGHSFPSVEDDLLLPLRIDRGPESLGNYWGDYGISLIARLAPAATPAEATVELRDFAGGPLINENPIWTPVNNYRAESTVTPLHEALVGDVRSRLLLLVAIVSVVLLVVAANVGNLLLARGLARRRDMAVRAALGAGRGRLVRTHLAEGLLLSVGGGAVGLGLAFGGLQVLRPILQSTMPRFGAVAIDLRVFAATAVIALVVGLAVGSIAALRGVDGGPGTLLRSSDRGGSGAPRQRLARGLVVAQIGAAVLLVIGAGLITRDIASLGAIPPDFDVDDLVTARLDVTGGRFSSAEEAARVLGELERRLKASPDLVDVAIGTSIPFSGQPNAVAAYIEGETPDPNALTAFAKHAVSVDYFRTMGMELLEGRLPTPADAAGAAPVAWVDEAAVRDVWGGTSPLGDYIQNYGPYGEGATIVGVVSSVRRAPIVDDPRPSWYGPLTQNPQSQTFYVIARLLGSSASGWGAIRSVVAEVAPEVPVTELLHYRERVSTEHSQTRFLAGVLGGFALVTLLLGALGVFGVTAYAVRQRTREFGVRVALGASAEGLRRRVVREGLVLSAIGSAVGLLAAIPAAGLMDAFLTRVVPLDPLTFMAVPFIMVLVTILAVYIPARRATRVDPAVALRAE